MKNHYVYKITNTRPIDDRKYYIGVRTSTKPPEDDDYWSSSKTLKNIIKKNGKHNFKKEILNVFETRKDANNEEIRLHKLFDVDNNSEFYQVWRKAPSFTVGMNSHFFTK
jgi:hypothetical protein